MNDVDENQLAGTVITNVRRRKCSFLHREAVQHVASLHSFKFHRRSDGRPADVHVKMHPRTATWQEAAVNPSSSLVHYEKGLVLTYNFRWLNCNFGESLSITTYIVCKVELTVQKLFWCEMQVELFSKFQYIATFT